MCGVSAAPGDRLAARRLAHLAVGAARSRCRHGLRAAREEAKERPSRRPWPAENKRATSWTQKRSAPPRCSKAWPYEEARKLLKRWPDGKPGGEPMLFETGYGPSGLPHIGTFNEVLRTTMVRHAYEELTGGADPADRVQRRHGRAAQGARTMSPTPEMLAEYLGKPLTRIPDPFGDPRKLRRTTIMRCCAVSSTASASTMNSSPRPTATPAAASTTTIRQVLRNWDDDPGRDAADPARGAAADLFAGAADLAGQRPGAAGAGRGGRRRSRHHRLHRRGRRRASSSRRSAAWPSCSGRSTGRCAGSRSASIMKWPARI